MGVYLLVYMCNILIISLVLSAEIKNENIANKTLSTNSTSLAHPKLNATKLTLATEGGGLSVNEPDLTLSRENLTRLIDMEAESVKTKEKSVVPRKGVDKYLPDNITVQKSSTVSNNTAPTHETVLAQNISDAKPLLTENTTKSAVANKTVPDVKLPVVEVHKKPLILSYESLASADNIQGPVNPTSKTSDKNQIPSPNDDIVKVYPSKANSHPGMIMPIVISILVVPMFAIVGYMALKRGKEAWKNRHYKRMDFLLDGMYND